MLLLNFYIKQMFSVKQNPELHNNISASFILKLFLSSILHPLLPSNKINMNILILSLFFLRLANIHKQANTITLPKHAAAPTMA